MYVQFGYGSSRFDVTDLTRTSSTFVFHICRITSGEGYVGVGR